MRRALISLLVVAATAMLAVPASAATRDVKVADFKFTPGTVTIAQQDTVNWRFPGPDFNHSVTSDPPGQAESFDSDPGKNFLINHPGGNYVFSHTFTKVGSFTYFCKIHDFMKGTVSVLPSGSPIPPPPDTSPPATKLGGKRRQDIDRAAIRVKLDEPGTVTVTGTVKVRGRRRAFRLKRVKKTLAANDSTRFALKLKRSSKRRVKRALRRGRRATARVKVVAVDRAGNRKVARKRIRLKP